MVEKRKGILFLIMLVVLVSVTACGTTDTTSSEQATSNKITATEAQQLIEEEPDLIVVDVRTEAEYAEGHLENAILIPSTEVESSVESILPDKDAKILLYCRTDNRSGDAYTIMQGLGYTDLYDLEGGISAWQGEIVQ